MQFNNNLKNSIRILLELYNLVRGTRFTAQFYFPSDKLHNSALTMTICNTFCGIMLYGALTLLLDS